VAVRRAPAVRLAAAVPVAGVVLLAVAALRVRAPHHVASASGDRHQVAARSASALDPQEAAPVAAYEGSAGQKLMACFGPPPTELLLVLGK